MLRLTNGRDDDDDDGDTTGAIVFMLFGALQLSVWQQEESPINSVLVLSIHCDEQ